MTVYDLFTAMGYKQIVYSHINGPVIRIIVYNYHFHSPGKISRAAFTGILVTIPTCGAIRGMPGAASETPSPSIRSLPVPDSIIILF
jgi:hypothetical protein